MVNTHLLRAKQERINDKERAEKLVKRLQTTFKGKQFFRRPKKSTGKGKTKFFVIILSCSHNAQEPVELKRQYCIIAHEHPRDIWRNLAKTLTSLFEKVDPELKDFNEILVEVIVDQALGFRFKPLGQIQRSEHIILKIEFSKILPVPTVL